MDLSLKKRILELEATKLPKSLTKFVYQTGRQRSDFTDYREWNLYSAMYKTLISLRGHEDFAILATRLFEYLDRHHPSVLSSSPSPEKPLTRKEKKKRREERAKSRPNQKLSAQLRNAKPSAATMIDTWKSSPVIGLGLESKLTPIPRVRREDIKIDEHTSPIQNQERSHILYAAGWSLNSDDS